MRYISTIENGAHYVRLRFGVLAPNALVKC